MKTTAYLLLLALPLLPGCVVLPIPHKQTAVPEIRGKLVPAPPAGTVVQYRLEPHSGPVRTGVTTTEPGGVFQIAEQRRWAYLFIVCLAPCDRAWASELELSAPAYGKHSERLLRFPVPINGGHVAPFDLGEIRLE
jgi:hypothetical protein